MLAFSSLIKQVFMARGPYATFMKGSFLRKQLLSTEIFA